MIVENFLPGTLAGWGIGYDDVKAVKEDIVYVSVSGWGQYGPLHRRVGYDPIALATAGWMSLNGDKDGGPTKGPTYLADDLAGVHGAMAGMAALRWRDQTGEGQHVDVSLFDSLLFQSAGWLTFGAIGVDIPRWGNEAEMATPVNVYQCTDGHVFIALVLDTHWRRLCEEMGHPELGPAGRFLTNEDRVQHRDEVNELVAAWCAGLEVSQVVAALEDAGIGVAPVQTYADAAAMPHVAERDMLQDTELSDGTTLPLTGPAAKFSRTPTRVRHRAPDLGEHTEDVFAEIGVTEAELADLRGRGVV